jgi:ubiquinone/menaquinone biosynthesis C-methylase UbiE
MKTEYYQEYYHLERSNWWFMARKHILRDQLYKLLKGRENLRILNVGAALGASSVMLKEFGNVTSIEYNKECCEFVKKQFNYDFIHGSITELPFEDNTFDVVCAFDVVEHVQEDTQAIKELHRVCKPGGFTFTTVPTFKFMWSEHDEINEHVRRYTMTSYLKLFNSVDSSICFRSYFNFWLFFPIAAFRIGSSLWKKNNNKKMARSDNSKINGGLLSKVLLTVFRSETYMLKKGVRLPVGVSLMVISRKSV